MTNQTAIRISAMLGFAAVGLGAFGAHGLESILERNDRVDTWQTAVFYHFIHTVLMLVLSFRQPFHRGPWFCFAGGILFFSGSLYVLALSNIRWLGAITPFGGVAFLAGWLWLALSAARSVDSDGSD